ncbi:MAG: threonine--tRNA ligase [Euzebya sp.]
MTPLDHITLGRDLEIFTTDPRVGPGLPLWLPNGTAIRRELDTFILELEQRAGYDHVMTPQLGKRQLYEASGHWDYFADDMFPAMQVGTEQLVLRPVNCPHHVAVYQHSERSFRDLPLRIAELGTMYRLERSGVVAGLGRVRAMTLNDAHIFCRPEEVAMEIDGVLDLVEVSYRALGLEVTGIKLSRRSPEGKWAGEEANWQLTEQALKSALTARGLDFEDAPGEAAFYGPKIDIEVTDVKGRALTLSTIQVDLWMPQRFGLEYVASGGGRERPVMIHRSVTSTAERLMALLLETTQGSFPFWLSAVQTVVLPVASAHAAQARQIADRIRTRGVRVRVDDHEATLGSRLRAASESHVPVIVILGHARPGTRAMRFHRASAPVGPRGDTVEV